jgi:hypothetical protein
MTPLDTELFNEFKRLDKLLKESRDTERGVSDYIDDMKEVPLYESDSIPDWDLDLDRLWYCRHLRNKLAHDTVSEDHPLCDPENVEFLKSFYARVLRGDDPLARLRKYRIQVRQARARSTPPPQQPPRYGGGYQGTPPRPQASPPRKQVAQLDPRYVQRQPSNSSEGCLASVIWVTLSVLAVPCVAAIIGFLIH